MVRLSGAIVLAATLVATSANADSPILGPIVQQMDSSAPRFQSSECAAARDAANNYDEQIAGRLATGAMLGLAFGFLALPVAMSGDAQKAQQRNLMIVRLFTACGSEAMAKWVDASKLGDTSLVQGWMGQGYEVEEEWPQTLDWYGRAIKQDNPDAEVRLGKMYYDGRGVTQDYQHAASLFSASAGNNLPAGQYWLAQAYLTGNGVPQDNSKALEQLIPAAKHRNADAEMLLASFYEKGGLVPQSEVKAYFWYSHAALNGQPDAAAKRDAIGQNLPSDHLRDINRKVAECHKSDFKQCSF